MRHYAQQFWIQGQDGKFEGSMPGVPKKEGSQDADKTDRKPNAFLAKMRKKLAEHKKSVMLLNDNRTKSNDKKPTATNRAEELLDLDKWLKKAEKYVPGLAVMRKEQEKMAVAINRLKKSTNPEYQRLADTVDKYYHAVAHCKAVRLGMPEKFASRVLGLGKEVLDVSLTAINTGKLDNITNKIEDSRDDMDANAYGRKVGDDPKKANKSCEELCRNLWPKGIDEDQIVR